MTPAPEKAAPIPAEDAVDTVASMLALNDGRKYVCGPDFDLAYKIVRALAEREACPSLPDSREAQIREDGPTPEEIDEALMRPFENDFAGMTEQQISEEERRAQDAINENEPWLEACAARRRIRARQGGNNG